MIEQPPAIRSISYSAEAGGVWVSTTTFTGIVTSIFIPDRHLANLARALARIAVLSEGEREGEEGR